MLSSGIYLLEVQVKKIRNTTITAGSYVITLRVGKNSSSSNFIRTGSDKEIQINARLQMNVDKSALQAQRCSISITSEDKKMIGLALVSIPQEMTTLSNTYKLTQNQDKRAEIQLKLKLSPFEAIKIQINRVKQQPLESKATVNGLSLFQSKDNNALLSNVGFNFSKTDILPSYINLKSKISEQPSQISSESRPQLKNFKVIEQEKVIKVSQSEIKRFRDEKQVYYQLYQIEKTKSEIALKFITTFNKKISSKYPNLSKSVDDSQPRLFTIEQRKIQKQNNNHQQQQNSQAHIQQLQQANRSLHRQVEQYKKIVEQLKEEMHKLLSKGENKKTTIIIKQNKILPDFLDLSFSHGQREKIPTKHRENPQQLSVSQTLKGLNLKQWLQVSIGERKQLQKLFLSVQPYQNPTLAIDNSEVLSTKVKQQLFEKVKKNLDKQFTSLLKSKQINKQLLINHRKQISKLLMQCFLQ